MEQRDVWQDMRKHLSAMAETIDGAFRKVSPFSRPGHPPINVYETPDEFIVRAEAPGITKEALTVKVQGRSLLIEAREDRAEFAGYECVCRERGKDEFSREIPLPDTADVEAEPAAALADGILTVRIKKVPAQEERSVDVKVD